MYMASYCTGRDDCILGGITFNCSTMNQCGNINMKHSILDIMLMEIMNIIPIT